MGHRAPVVADDAARLFEGKTALIVDDNQTNRRILEAMLGNWGLKGGLFLAAGMKIAPYPLPKYPKSDKPKADGSDGNAVPVGTGVGPSAMVTSSMRQSSRSHTNEM